MGQCERHYHGASWRRLCVCDDAEPRPEAEPDASACLLRREHGRPEPDPECCARPSEASCATGYEYRQGALCMWSHDHDYFTTECFLQAVPTPAPSLPSFAEGFFLGPRGQASCSAVCGERGMTCSAQGFRDVYGQISNFTEVSRIVAAIGARDWLGLNMEKITPQCCKTEGRTGSAFGPAYGAAPSITCPAIGCMVTSPKTIVTRSSLAVTGAGGVSASARSRGRRLQSRRPP